jgi:hypothetical protein
MLRLIDRHGLDGMVDVEEIHRLFQKLLGTELAETVVFAFGGENRLPQLNERVFDWATARADDELVNAEMPSALRSRVLIKRPDLITGVPLLAWKTVTSRDWLRTARAWRPGKSFSEKQCDGTWARRPSTS